MAKRLTIAIDTGGTFTDCVYRVDGRLQVLKVPSTPDDPGRAILQAIEKIVAVTNATSLDIRHGTTVATNALLERKGARVAFVTTAGFEDTLSIGRQARPSLYDWNIHRPEPLAGREMCFGIEERIASDGSVVKSLAPMSLHELRERVSASGAESIAVSLLFSFTNAEHERAILAALQPLFVPISLSHQILPEFREFERASTVTVNAYVSPRMAGYITELGKALAQCDARFSIMQSSGGILSAKTAAEEPVRTILSGPAGGVTGALSVARQAKLGRIISFDMGGTSTDVSLNDATREPVTSVEGQIGGLPVRVPMLDIHTAGAGGGSLAWIDAAGALHVGPESAGATPGPACYGRGERATVTDADLVLGRLHPQHFLGGAMHLDETRALDSLEKIYGSLRDFASIEALAEGVVRVADAQMESALRRVSIERGQDPRSCALLAFGGAGPLHACALASALGIGKVLIPSAPGALSALGILDADLRREFSLTVMSSPLSSQNEKVFEELEEEAREVFKNEGSKASLTRSADLRYQGQGFELRVDWSARVVDNFHRLHAISYGYSDRQRPVEIVTLRVQAISRTPKPAFRAALIRQGAAKQGQIGSRRIFEDGRWRRGAIYDRALLLPGDRFTGPAVIVELSATTYLPSGWRAVVDRFNNLVLTPVPKRNSPTSSERRGRA